MVQPNRRTNKMKLEFRFCYPPSMYGTYDTGNGVIHIFGVQPEHNIEEVISHETLHFVVQKLEGKEACLALDNFSINVYKK